MPQRLQRKEEVAPVELAFRRRSLRILQRGLFNSSVKFLIKISKLAVIMKTAFFLSLATCASVNAVQLKGYLSKDDIPSSGKDWYTLDNGVEFQPSDNVDPRVEHVRKLWGNSNAQDDPIFVDGSETKYDENAQAWRLLGFYVDCNHCDDANNEAECLAAGEKTYCQRYLLWAAVSEANMLPSRNV